MNTTSRVARFVAVVALLLLAPAALAQSLKHEKYQLPNGMTVILHEDHTLPVATINLWYRVGAKNEPPGRSGFAHLFEHLMFMGTQRVPGNAFDVIMETGGGSNNASTGFDRTNYFSSGPASLLPTLLWLDADRLEDLGRTMDQSKLDKQRDVVRNELRQSVENAPYGKAGEIVYQYLYPVGHPYHFGVIGTHEDLEAANVANVKDFFATFYVPNNCSLVVAGDFDPAKIKPLIAELFGTLPRGSAPAQPKYVPQRIDGVKRATMLDKVQLPKVGLYYHSPPTYAEGDAELQLLSMVLADGPSSRLYQRLVLRDQLASSVSAAQDGATLGSIFKIEVLAKPDADLSRVEAIVDEELGRILSGSAPITAAELTPRKNTIETALISTLQSVGARADKLNEYEYFYGQPDALQRDLDRYRKAAPEAVMTWAKNVLTPDARFMVRVLPEEPANRTASARDKRPADTAMPAFTPPAPERFKLAAGPEVLLYRRPELPLVSMELLVVSPTALDPLDRSGRTTLMAAMLSEGTQKLDNVQFAQALQDLGASFGASASNRTFTASVSSLKKNFDAAANLFADAIRTPRLAETDWNRVHGLHIEDLRQADEEPRSLAPRVSARLLFGAGNPFAWPSEGTVDTVTPLTLADIRAAHAEVVRPERATILIAGDITADEAKATLERVLAGWKPAGAAPTAGRDDTSIPRRDAMGFYIIDRPGATQTVIHYRAPGVPFNDKSRVARRVLNTILGASFTSRLNANLREEHGYTYGAGSRMSFDRDLGSFVATSSVKADVTGPALAEFMKEFARLRSGDKGDITPAEATKAIETIRTETIQAYGSLGGALGTAAGLLAVGAPLDTIAADLRALESINADQLNALAKPALPLDRGVLVLVGDKNLILQQIEKLPLPKPEIIDAQGKPAK